MAKLIKKSKCTFEAGHIIKKEKVIHIPYTVWCQLNKLELIMQQYDYLVQQKPYCPGPSLEGFERESALTIQRPYVKEPDTPVTDKRIAEAMAFMEEVDATNNVEKINDLIDEYGELIDWAASDKFIEGTCDKEIDTPLLGNPLELTAEYIVKVLRAMLDNPIVLAD